MHMIFLKLPIHASLALVPADCVMKKTISRILKTHNYKIPRTYATIHAKCTVQTWQEKYKNIPKHITHKMNTQQVQ